MKNIFDAFKRVTDIYFFNILLIMVLLLDYYFLHYFEKGFFEIDYSEIINLYNVKHLIILLIIFGITYFWLSELLFTVFHKIWAMFFYKTQNNSDFVFINDLKKISIETKNQILMDYIKMEENHILIRTKNRKTVYTLLIFTVLDCVEKNSLVKKLFKYLLGDNDGIIKLFILSIIIFLFGTILYTVYCSIAIYDDNKIYYKQ